MSCVESRSDESPATIVSEQAPFADAPVEDRRELLARSALSLCDQIVVSASTFLTMFLVSRNCSQTEVGLFALAATIINLTRTVQERSIAAPYLAFTYQSEFDRKSYKGSSFIHQALLASACSILILISVLVGWRMNLTATTLALTASLAVALPLLLLRDQIRAISAAHFKFGTQLLLDLIIGMTQLSILLLLAWINQFTISRVNVVLGLACFVPSLVWLIAARNTMEFDRRIALADWAHNWRYSRWLVGARVFGILGYVAIPWMVAYYLDEASTGAFAVCSSLVGVSLMFVTGLNNFFQPRTIRQLHHNGLGGMRKSLLESILMITLLLISLSIGFVFFADFALSLLFGATYGKYGYVVVLLSLSTLSVSFSVLFGNGLAALGNSREYFWGELASCLLSIGSAIVFIPAWGLAGAAFSLICGGIGASVVTGLTLVRAIKRRSQTVEE